MHYAHSVRDSSGHREHPLTKSTAVGPLTRPWGESEHSPPDATTGGKRRTTVTRQRGQTAVDTGDLVRSAAAGDRQAWAELVDTFGALILSIARAHRLREADVTDV